MKIKSLLLLPSVLLLLACTDDERNSHPTPEGAVVERTFAVTALPMQQADGTPQTRSAMSDAEKAIHTLRFVQFDGVEATSTVCCQGEVALVNDKATLPLLPYEQTTRVYLLANMEQPEVTQGTTTLADFEKMPVDFAPTTTVPANGLPMFAFADIRPMDVQTAPAFALTAMVAKVNVTMSIDPAIEGGFTQSPAPAIYLCNAASATTFGAPADLAPAHRPADVTFAGDIKLGAAGTYTYYVAENRAGRNASVKRLTQRSVENAQPDALCFELRSMLVSDMDVVFSLFGGDVSTVSDFNVKRGCAYTLTATLKGLNRADERLLIYDNLSEAGTANCYIVTDNAAMHYSMNATVRGNGYESTSDPNVAGIHYSTLPDLGTATEARVIWQTGNSATELLIDPASVRLLRGKVVFGMTGKMDEGNAVIGIFASSDENAECLWSWHIWKLNGAAPTNVSCTKILAATGSDVQFYMMDRNLGAYNNTEGDNGSMGLYYQWGRKDPFPGVVKLDRTEFTSIYGTYNNGGITGTWNGAYSLQTSRADDVGTEAWAVKYPTALILSNITDFRVADWMSVGNNCLWGTPWSDGVSINYSTYNRNNGTKSIYDPCPVGYRVPPQDTCNKEFGEVTFRNYGAVLNSVATGFWFPASGLYKTGQSAVTEYGYYWSSSPYDASNMSGSCMFFYVNSDNNTAGTSPTIDLGRAYGNSVRCVVE